MSADDDDRLDRYCARINSANLQQFVLGPGRIWQKTHIRPPLIDMKWECECESAVSEWKWERDWAKRETRFEVLPNFQIMNTFLSEPFYHEHDVNRVWISLALTTRGAELWTENVGSVQAGRQEWYNNSWTSPFVLNSRSIMITTETKLLRVKN